MARRQYERPLAPGVLAVRLAANRDLWTGESLSPEQLRDKYGKRTGRLPEGSAEMLMIRRKQWSWIDIVHPKSGDVISIQVKEVVRIGGVFQVTLAVQDDPRNFEVVKPDRPRPVPDEGQDPPPTGPRPPPQQGGPQ